MLLSGKKEFYDCRGNRYKMPPGHRMLITGCSQAPGKGHQKGNGEIVRGDRRDHQQAKLAARKLGNSGVQAPLCGQGPPHRCEALL